MKSSVGICHLSLVPVRAEASDKSEMISQLLFGDLVRVVILEEKWAFVQSRYDDYLGWIDRKQFTPLREEDLPAWEGSYMVSPGMNVLVKKAASDEEMWLAPGSSLPVASGGPFFINEQLFIAPSKVWQPDTADFNEKLELVARSFLNAPYLWGGRSPFGIDCSGFTQVAFKLLGVKLPRDSSQQALKGEVVHFLTEGRKGDLAFFDNDEGKIIHVGILLDNSTIIHASGRVKIETVDSQGIYSAELGRHTHKLRIIKRYI